MIEHRSAESRGRVEASAPPGYFPVRLTTSVLATFAGLIVLRLVNSPGPKVHEAPALFGNRGYVRASLGDFGHMWDLYALLAFIPVPLPRLVTVRAPSRPPAHAP